MKDNKSKQEVQSLVIEMEKAYGMTHSKIHTSS